MEEGGRTRKNRGDAANNHTKMDNDGMRIAMAGKKYASVSDMLADNAPTAEFREEFEAQVAKRRVIKHLIALRIANGMSQKDIADRVECSQSCISKLEHGMDDAPDVTFVRRKRLPEGRVPREPVPELAPSLAIEVVSQIDEF